MDYFMNSCYVIPVKMRQNHQVNIPDPFHTEILRELYPILMAGEHFLPVVTAIHQDIQGFDAGCSNEDTLPESDIQEVYD
jgi:hypothetical protein